MAAVMAKYVADPALVQQHGLAARRVALQEFDLDVMVEQYLGTVRPMHLEFVEPSKRYAHLIVPEGGRNQVAMEMIISRIHKLLDEAG